MIFIFLVVLVSCNNLLVPSLCTPILLIIPFLLHVVFLNLRSSLPSISTVHTVSVSFLTLCLVWLILYCLLSVYLQKLSAYNTRLFKRDKEGKACYEVRLASAVQKGQNYRLA